METAGAAIKSFLETFNKAKLKQLNELRKENEFCDLTLKCDDGFEIKVHRVVVCSASNYFKDLLTLPMKEKFEEYISMPDITGDVLDKIITFIYTSEFEAEIEDVEKIIKYAVIFQLQELVEIYSIVLSKSITDNNCLKYWRFAKNNLINSLEDKCLSYIASKADNLFENLLMSDLTMEEMKLLNKGAKLTKQKCKEAPDCLIFSKPPQGRLIGLASNKMFIGLGEENTIEKDVNLRLGFGYTTFDNKLLICGGGDSNSCEFFDPSTQQWKKFPFMRTGKKWHQCLNLDNKIYACGGTDSKTVEIFDLGEGKWGYGPAMLKNNWNFGLSRANGALYAIGGVRLTVEIFDPRTQKWSIVCSDFCIHKYVRSVSSGPCIYCFTVDKRYIFDTRSNRFSKEFLTGDYRKHSSICQLDGYFHYFGYHEDLYTTWKYSLDHIQFHFDGKQGFKKSYGLYNEDEVTQPAIVSLYY